MPSAGHLPGMPKKIANNSCPRGDSDGPAGSGVVGSDAEMIQRVGRTLYGERWLNALAGALGDIPPRTVRGWAAGRSAVPEAVMTRMWALVLTRIEELETLLEEGVDVEN
jgi:hypothetical protein